MKPEIACKNRQMCAKARGYEFGVLLEMRVHRKRLEAAKTMKENVNCSISNIYKLDGRVPIGKAIPFGLQHILAMFVSNLAPITMIAGAAKVPVTGAELGMLLQNAMFAAGIATMIQLYPLWKIGSRLPVVMGVSFTFVTVLSTISANYGYPAVIGAVLIGGLFE